MKRAILSVLILGTLLVAVPILTSETCLAAYDFATGTIEIIGSDGILSKALSFFLNAVIFIGIMMVVYAGYRYMTSGGDSTKVQAALQNIIYALVGIAIAILAKILINFVINWVTGQPYF
ncbi:MAG: hypothetical protein WC909_03960 [Candidatus Paceibacterota bacterium]|jgi:hypothetical protein